MTIYVYFPIAMLKLLCQKQLKGETIDFIS